MESFKLYLAGFGFPDCYLESHSLSTFEIHKKGEVWRSRTGEKYTQNIFKYAVDVIYETGFNLAINQIIGILNKDNTLLKIVSSCKDVELQVSVITDQDFRIPHIHFTSEQMVFLGKIGIDIEIHIC